EVVVLRVRVEIVELVGTGYRHRHAGSHQDGAAKVTPGPRDLVASLLKTVRVEHGPPVYPTRPRTVVSRTAPPRSEATPPPLHAARPGPPPSPPAPSFAPTARIRESSAAAVRAGLRRSRVGSAAAMGASASPRCVRQPPVRTPRSLRTRRRQTQRPNPGSASPRVRRHRRARTAGRSAKRS